MKERKDKDPVEMARLDYIERQAIFGIVWGILAAFMEHVQENVYDRFNSFQELSEALGNQDSLAGAFAVAALTHYLDLFLEVVFPDAEKLRKFTPVVMFTIAMIYHITQLLNPEIHDYADNTFMDIVASGGAIALSKMVRNVFSGIHNRRTGSNIE